MSESQKILRILELNDRKITLVGTAHVSKESIEDVQKTIEELKPDCVAVELDEKRADSIINNDKYKNFDIIKVLKNNEGFLLLANLVLSSFQRRMGQNVGVKPGDEMLSAITCAKEKGINVSLVDRPIQVTLRRAWAKNSLWGKCKLLAAMLTSAFSKEEISENQIEEIKNQNEMDSMMAELSEFMPVIKEVLIDERDKYLASKIWNSKGNNIVAVLGAGHLNGVVNHLEKMALGTEDTNIENISDIPPKSKMSKSLPWLIPVFIVAVIVLGFIFGGKSVGLEMIWTWVLCNAIPSGILSIVALAHPVTVIVSAVAAPFTSLCPLIGVGFVSGLVQALICRPKVSDMETIQDDVSSVKGFYKNRILRVLLVFVLSTIGSSIGTWVAVAKFGVTLGTR